MIIALRFFWAIVFLLIATLYFLYPVVFGVVRVETPHLKIVFLEASSDHKQADAALIQIANGANFLIDVGNFDGRVLSRLNELGVNQLESIIISHPHKDHYGGLEDLIESKIIINKVYFSLPNKEACDREKPWGCDWDHLKLVQNKIRQKGIEIGKLNEGEVNNSLGHIRVLHAYDDKTAPVQPLDINDMSQIIRVTVGETRILFTGDLNAPLGRYLVEYSNDLVADILKVPHHGMESLAPSSFFDKVQAEVAVIPNALGMSFSGEAKRVRHYFNERKIPILVNGIHGDIVFLFDISGQYEIRTSRTNWQIMGRTAHYLKRDPRARVWLLP